MTIAPEAHRAKRQVLDPCFSKRRVNMMEQFMHAEIGRVFDKMDHYVTMGEDVPIHELLYCYTVLYIYPCRENERFVFGDSTDSLQADIVSELLFGKSLDMISASDFLQRVRNMQFFTAGVWTALHFPLLRVLVTDAPRWLAAWLSATYVEMTTVRCLLALGNNASTIQRPIVLTSVLY